MADTNLERIGREQTRKFGGRIFTRSDVQELYSMFEKHFRRVTCELGDYNIKTLEDLALVDLTKTKQIWILGIEDTIQNTINLRIEGGRVRLTASNNQNAGLLGLHSLLGQKIARLPRSYTEIVVRLITVVLFLALFPLSSLLERKGVQSGIASALPIIGGSLVGLTVPMKIPRYVKFSDAVRPTFWSRNRDSILINLGIVLLTALASNVDRLPLKVVASFFGLE